MSDDLDVLIQSGLIDATGRPPLAPLASHAIMQQIDDLQASLGAVNEETSGDPHVRLAFNLLRLGSLFDHKAGTIPPAVRDATKALLTQYIGVILMMADQKDEDESVGAALQDVLSIAFILGYVTRAMEVDGRWADLSKL
jgi:hypothetical protein